eukprot:4774741-Karenia_brevis.AAC.1
MIQGVDSPKWVDKPQVEVDGGKKSWIVGAVIKSVPKHIRREESRFENLVEEEDGDEEEDNDE